MCCTDFAAILFNFFFNRRSREINGGEANDDAAAHNETARGSSSTHTSAEGQGTVTLLGDYEVFLSFRGPDTREGFTDFLYTSLCEARIRTFKDDETLRIGEAFGSELLRAIDQSKISIPIFSKGYASSTWCLKELVQMVKCWKNGRQQIMPIFYDVAPSEVRHQTGGYGLAFCLHKMKRQYDKETISGWKAALTEVSSLTGWSLHNETNRHEGQFAKRVTQEVFNKLKKACLKESDNLVNVDDQVDKIMEMVGAHTSETRIIGICGMGGIGKTTIATTVYNRLSENFTNRCFLLNIREKSQGIECLQNQLISDILKKELIYIESGDEGTQKIKSKLSKEKVLIFLDDVDDKKHMDALVGNHDWFGRGSKLIITTRKKELLRVPEVDDIYDVNIMDPEQSLQLFSKHSFRRGDINQSMRAIKIAGGLPLALEVIGSLLSKIDEKEWEVKLRKLEDIPEGDVQKKLKISYDVLQVHEKRIFLDIACFFSGCSKFTLVYFWESRFHPEDAMNVLENMCLIKITKDNEVLMHGQLRDLGRQIIREDSNMEIKEQCKVWDPKEALDLLSIHEEKKKLEALRLPLDHQHCFAYEDFKRLPNLKFLEVCNSNETSRNKSLSSVLPTDVFQENSDLLPKLRWLAWPNIPPTFKIMNFSMKNVVILNLSNSRIRHNWEGWSHMKVMENLKVMDLSNCDYLKRTPNFSAHSKLERLILKVCWGLVEIKSICQLESLVFLDVSYCRKLQSLPDTLGELKLLKELDILDTGIKKLPDSIGELKLLKKLNISRMGIEELPHSIRNLTSLIELDISGSEIKELPDSIESLKSLIKLDISDTEIEELPDSIEKLKNLKVVKMNGYSTSKIPDGLWRMKTLEVIEVIADCQFDVKIGDEIFGNQALRILELNEARIYKVPRLPKGLTILKLSDLYMNTFPDLSNLTNLEKLELEFARHDSDGPVEDPMLVPIGNLTKLKSVVLRSPYVTALPDMSLLLQLKHLSLECPTLDCLPSLPFTSSLWLDSECLTTLPTDMSSLLPRLKTLLLRCPNPPCLRSLPSGLSSLCLESVTILPTNMSSLLPRLEVLKLRRCPNLLELPSLPSSLRFLRLEDCKLCSSMGDLSNLKTLEYLHILEYAISEIQGLDSLENLQILELGKLQRVEILPDLRNLNRLSSLKVSDCGNLVEIQGEFPPSLLALEILGCGSLEKLPDLSSLKELPSLLLKRCEKLDVEAIYSLYPKEEVEFEGDDCESGCEFDDESEGEDDESGYEFDNESEGEDDESGCKSEYGSKGED